MFMTLNNLYDDILIQFIFSYSQFTYHSIIPHKLFIPKYK